MLDEYDIAVVQCSLIFCTENINARENNVYDTQITKSFI